MGLCFSKNDRRIREINFTIAQANWDLEEVKLLFLGAYGSGKTTLFRQFRCIHGVGLHEPERRMFTDIVHWNLLDGMKTLIRENLDGFAGKYNCAQEISDYILDLNPNRVTKTTAEVFKKAWTDKGILETWENRSEIYVPDSLSYFIANIDRIASDDYVPSKDDILHVRVRTTGLAEENLTINSRLFKIVDVGGNRAERPKWRNCFSDVNGLIFVVSLISYDETLYGDGSMNRMKDSLCLFKFLCSELAFRDSYIVVLLNKSDLFSEIVSRRPITSCFPEYTGDLTEFAQYEYIRKMYEMQNTIENRKIFFYKTCATNTDQMKIIFNTINQDIIKSTIIS